MSENIFQIGDEVVFVSSYEHEFGPQYYPKVGTVGTIVEVLPTSYVLDLRIQWPKGSTSGNDKWEVLYDWVEPFPDQGEIEKSDLPISFLLNVEVSV